jgi:hypothetical protein
VEEGPGSLVLQEAAKAAACGVVAGARASRTTNTTTSRKSVERQRETRETDDREATGFRARPRSERDSAPLRLWRLALWHVGSVGEHHSLGVGSGRRRDLDALTSGLKT